MRLRCERRGILFPDISNRRREICRHQFGSCLALLSAALVRLLPCAQWGKLNVTILLDARKRGGLDRRRLDGLRTADAARRTSSRSPAVARHDGSSAARPPLIPTAHGVGSCRRLGTAAVSAWLCGSLPRQARASCRRSGLSEGTPQSHAPAAPDLAGTRCGRDRRRRGRASSLRETATQACGSIHPAATGRSRRAGCPSIGRFAQGQRPLAAADSHALAGAAEAGRPVYAAISILTQFAPGNRRKLEVAPVSFGKPLYDLA